MRVLHVLGELRPSGAEVMLRTAAPYWRDHDVSADILSTGNGVGPYGPELATAGYGIHHLPFERDPRFAIRFATFLRKHPYDIVHLHTERAFIHLGLAARARGLGVIRTVHNTFTYQGVLHRRRSRQRRIARKVGIRFVAIGPTVAENERSRFMNPMPVVPNWFDAKRFTPTQHHQRNQARARLQLPPGQVVAVTVGNCSPTKNHLSLLEALSKLEEAMLLLHVGEEQDSEERELTHQLGLLDRCRFLGRVDPLRAMRAADLFVMPSLYEGLPIAPLEALATGLPAVLTEVPGNVDLRSLSDDIIWTSTDPEDLRAALMDAQQRFQAPRTQAVREQQSRRVRARHGAQAGVEGYVDLYRQTAG
jgi:glycosyltransferase involved in cell wall biosynthesis